MKKRLYCVALCFAFSFLSIMEYNAIAQATFQKIIGETGFYDRGNSVQQTNDGGYIIGGSTVRAGEVGENTEKIKNIYLIKTDASGN